MKLYCSKTKKILLIIDNKIPLKFKKNLKNKLKNYNLLFLPFSSNEKNKSIKTVNYYLKKLLSNNFNRSDLIIGVGGGITGDVAGFVASIFKRGINFINIPTIYRSGMLLLVEKWSQLNFGKTLLIFLSTKISFK